MIANAWSEQECERALAAVREAAAQRGGWMTDRHSSHSTTDIPSSALGAETDGWVRATVGERIIETIAKRHGWCPKDIRFGDLFFVRYAAAEGAQRGLGMHRDSSKVSINVLLNKPADFDGGGTFFEAEGKTYCPERGHCLVHAGRVLHCGVDITRGERLVLVGFLQGRMD